MPETLRGIPITDDWGWVVLIRRYDAVEWFPALFTVARTRADAIARFDAVGGETYVRQRRRGRARAVHARVVPCTFGEDRRRQGRAAETTTTTGGAW